MEPDFSGYATKADLKCSDGRTITAGAFKHMDGQTVPLLWQHGHNSAENVLGHAVLEARPDGLYAYGFFNDTKQGVNARALVAHKDINRLSIYANQLVEKGKRVFHGFVREVSLVLAGANPGALIDQVRIAHGADPDDILVLEEEAIIHTGLEIDVLFEDEELEHAESDSIQDILDTFNEDQRNVMLYYVGKALEVGDGDEDDAKHSDIPPAAEPETNPAPKAEEAGALAHKEGTTEVTHNVFDRTDAMTGAGGENSNTLTLSHSDLDALKVDIFKQWKQSGSLKEAAGIVLGKYAQTMAHAEVLQHGISSIDVLFPDYKNLTTTPEFNKRRTEWVSVVLNGVGHTPFSRVKSIVADITLDEARAKGYVKGNFKTEEWFGVTKRTTGPTTVYKKQKLDRDDIVDITDFNVVAWLKAEMRIMLEEEVARAILIGDGRTVGHVDKIKDPAGATDGVGIRSIAADHELYATTLYVNIDDANSSYEEIVDRVMDGMEFYKGTGTPTFFTTIKHANGFKKAKDGMQRRYYETNAQVAEALGVDKLVTVEPMNEVSDLIGIIVNLVDYNVGADQGGEITLFDDFDLDYNQQKYLMETRISGALIRIKSALIIKKVASGAALVVPLKPTFVSSTGVVTIPTVTGVVYKDGAGTTLTAGAQTALAAGASMVVNATPASSSYYFANTAEDGPWTFTRPA